VRGVILLTATLIAGLHGLLYGQVAGALALLLGGPAYVVLTTTTPALKRDDAPLYSALTALDILLITAIVWISGGVRSEYYLLYYIPVAHAAVRRNPRDGIGGAVLACILFTFVSLIDDPQAALVTTVPLRVAGFCLSGIVLVVFFTLLGREAGVSQSMREALHNSLRRMAAVYDVAHAANAGADLTNVLSVLLDHAARATRAQSGAIAFLKPDGLLEVQATLEIEPSDEALPIDCTSEFARRAIATHSPVTVAQEQPLCDSAFSERSDLIYVPLVTPSGPIGVLALAFPAGRKLTRTHGEFLASLCAEAGTAVENAQLRAQLGRLAVTDSLTGLPNRREIERRLGAELERTSRERRPLTVLMIDVDNLKFVNDRYGHAAGDDVLCSLAHVLEDALRGREAAGRVGGDEFLVVLPDSDAAVGTACADALIANFARELRSSPSLDATAHSAGVSIGVAASHGEVSPAELIARADAALYEAKRSGKNRARLAPTGSRLTVTAATAADRIDPE
jgi:diguanylate cyclase (GGDEF)-like protein